jgi:hypothetical protein
LLIVEKRRDVFIVDELVRKLGKIDDHALT